MSNIGNQSFIDGVGDVRLRDGIVRMDLLTLSATWRDEDGNPVPELSEQLVMSPAAFGRMVTALGQTVKKMRENGMLVEVDGSADDETEAAPTTDTKSGGSPNFK